MRTVVLLLCLLGCTVASAQLPDAPKPQKDHVETALLFGAAASRALDVYSTHQMLNCGYQEIVLPKAIADRTASMAVYSAGAFTLDWMIARHLERHGHHKWARTVTSIDIGLTAPWAVRNLTLSEGPAKIPLNKILPR